MNRRYELKVLSDNDIDRIHKESLKILLEIGVKFPSKLLLTAFQELGAIVDFDTETVKFPAKLIDYALKVHRDNTDQYYKERGGFDDSDYTQRFFMSGGNVKHTIDPLTHQRREGCLEDMLKAIAVGNALKNVDRVSAFMIPHEYDPKLADVVQFYLLSLFSRKRHFFTYIYSLPSAKCLIEMARVVAENDRQFSDGSLIEYELEPSGHLQFAKENIEIAAEFARRGMKIATTHWGWMGYHSPVTYASLLALTNAHILAGAVALVALNPKNMFFRYIFPTHSVNRKQTNLPLMGNPNQVIFAWAARQLADFYGFKFCITNSGFSDAIEDNFQSGFEVGVTAALAIAAGVTCLGVKGIVGIDQAVSLERLVADNEMIDYLNFVFSRRLKIDELCFDFEKVKRTAFGGNFLSDLKDAERTRDTHWESDIFFSGSYDGWHRAFSQEKIRAKIDGILRDGFPPKPVLDRKMVEKLERVMTEHIGEKGFVERFKRDLAKIIPG
jgi:trimethylamine--corrinoid protein Co-methyltransferase